MVEFQLFIAISVLQFIHAGLSGFNTYRSLFIFTGHRLNAKINVRDGRRLELSVQPVVRLFFCVLLLEKA